MRRTAPRVPGAWLSLAAGALVLMLLWLPETVRAERQVPQGFIGTMIDGPLTEPGFALEPELDLMVSSGVEHVRFAIYWSDAQPYAGFDDVPAERRARYRDQGGVPTDYAEVDRLVAAATSRGLRVLPTVLASPTWATRYPGRQFSGPADPRTYARFLAALVRRYRPGGAFWSERPDLTPRPVRDWQIWNEPNRGYFWPGRATYAADYVALLRPTRAAIKTADPGARVTLGGLVNASWNALEDLYRAGAKGLFDVAAIHPFTLEVSNVVKILRRARAVMRRHGDDRVPLAVTELSWPSAQGRVTRYYGFEVTERVQAQRITKAYGLLSSLRRKLRLTGVTWYTWLSAERQRDYSFDWAGLRRLSPAGPRDKPARAAFAQVARRLEGCAKGALATVCR